MTRKHNGSDTAGTLWILSVERFAPLNVFLLIAVFALGLAVHLSTHSFSAEAVGLC